MENNDVDVTINVSGAKEEIERAIERAMTKCGIIAEGYAKLLCRVDTGRLRGSITYATKTQHSKGTPLRDGTPSPPEDYELHGAPKENEMFIGTNVEYAEHIELDVKPFLRPAIEGHIDEYKRIIQSELNGLNGQQ